MGYIFKELTQLETALSNGKFSLNRIAPSFNYVSLGDSIAAGHSINSKWESDYGTGSQFGENGNTSTTIVTGSYTDLIRNHLVSTYSEKHITVTSFAHSGDTNTDLRNKLNDDRVLEAIKKSDLVTVCIGANTVLGKAITQIPNFITQGAPTLQDLENTFNGSEGFPLLNGSDTDYGSYRNIFKRLAEINKKSGTKFVFTTVYNPYKYLWLDKSTDGNDYTDGYFGPTCSISPNIEVTNPLTGNELIDVRKFIYTYEISGVSFKLLTERVNDPFKNYPDYISQNGRLSLAQWVEIQVNKINEALRDAIEWARKDVSEGGMGDKRFILADTKSLYESVPDKLITADKHYNDLVNVELVRGETAMDLDWGELHETWEGNSLIENAKNIVIDTVTKVVKPDLDPHPEEYGQYALYRSFADALGWESLVKHTITYSTGEGGTVGDEYKYQTVASLLNNPVFAIVDPDGVNASNQGYRLEAWSAKTGYYWTGFSLSSGTITPFVVDGVTLYYYVMISSDVTLSAQWSNMYQVSFYKSFNDQAKLVYDTVGGGVSNNTGRQEIYGVDISNDGGVTYSTLDTSRYHGNFASSGSKLIDSRPYSYGTKFRVWVTYDDRYKSTTSHIYLNGGMLSSAIKPIAVITLSSDTSIDFEWFLSGNIFLGSGTANWNCHINTNSTVERIV